MTKETITRISILFGFILGLLSSLIALLTGGDLFLVIIERFFLVIIAGATLTWITLTAVNSVVIGAARKSIDELSRSLNRQNPSPRTGTNIDLTSVPAETVDMVGKFGIGEEPEISEPATKFEPLRPREIDTDKE